MAYKMSPNARLIVSLVVIFAIVIPLLLAYVLIYPPGFSPTRTTAVASTSTTTGSSGGNTIIIPAGIGSNINLNFEPASLTVAPGTTVTWMNQDTSIHDIHFTVLPSGATVSPNPSPDTNTWSGNTFSVTLTVPGTYTYICDFHSWMKGTIVVS